jgi:SAM-dependent methyltransferase
MGPTMGDRYLRVIREHPEISRQDIRVLRHHLPDARRIVDIGCGRGEFLGWCKGEFDLVIGLDLSAEAVRMCTAEGISGIRSDALFLPLRTGAVDVVRAKEIIEHLPDPLSMVREACRVLKPGGLFLAHVPSQYSALYPVGNFYDDYTHVRPLSRGGARRLGEDGGFEPLSIHGYTAGRNRFERGAGRILALVLPHTWRILARKPL